MPLNTKGFTFLLYKADRILAQAKEIAAHQKKILCVDKIHESQLALDDALTYYETEKQKPIKR